MIPKPESIGVRLDMIPDELKCQDRFVMWDWHWKGGKWGKVPKQLDGSFAKTNDENTWCSFKDAAEAIAADRFAGLGFVLFPGITGVDVDDCYDSEGWSPKAELIQHLLGTYAEMSPSGKGLKCLAFGRLDDKLRKISHGEGIELYDGATTNRFFCLTGHVLEGEKYRKIVGARDQLFSIQCMISEPKKQIREFQEDPERASKAIDFLNHLSDDRADEYGSWLSIGMALNWCDRSDRMLERWIDWSSKSDSFVDDEDCREKWESFKRDRSERVVTLGTLKKLAKEDGYDPERFSTGSITGTTLLAKEIVREYLVEDFMVKGEPMVIGGAAKALKTTIALDLAVSIASGSKFLGQFEVAEPQRVLFISGESGESTLQENLRMMVDGKGLHETDVEDFLIGFKLPKLDDPEMVEALIDEMQSLEVGIVFIDPLYRSLRVGDGASNVYTMGEQLELIAEKIHRAGITPVLLHHFKKQGKSHADPPELEDLSQSGVAEFGRQFLLIKRRESYQMDGRHTLWFHWGGSAGHQGMKMLEAATGTRQSGLMWETTLRNPAEWKAERDEAEGIKRAEEKEAMRDERVDKIREFIIENPGCSTRSIRDAVGGTSSIIQELLERLETSGIVSKQAGPRRSFKWFAISGSVRTTEENH